MSAFSHLHHVSWRREITGLATGFAVLATWRLLELAGVSLPYPSLIYLTAIVTAGFVGGILSGFALAALCIADLSQFLHLIDASATRAVWHRFALNAALLPSMALLVGTLTFRLERSAESARRQHARMMDAIESMEEAFALFDAEDRLIVCNSNYKAFFPAAAAVMVPGTRYESIVRVNAHSGQIPGIRGAEEAWIAERMAGHRRADTAQLLKLDDNRWIRVTEHPTREGGRVGIRADVTVLKRREEELAASEARFRAAAEAALDALVVLHSVRGPAGTIVDFRYDDVNRSACGVLGMAREQILGRGMLELFPTEGTRALFAKALEVMESKDPQALEQRPSGHGANARWMHHQIVRLNDGVMISSRDLTDSKRTEEQLRQSQKMEAVGQLTSGIAHDFNNLLTVIVGNVELLKRGLEGPRARQAASAVTAALKGSELTGRLLAFSRKQTLQPKPTAVNDLVAETIQLLKRTLGETIEVQLHGQQDLWTTLVDPGQLENAIVNLAVNSRDAMPLGGRLVIETSNTHLDDAYASANPDVSAGDYVLIMVSDTGSGMPREVLERAFDPFFTTKPAGKGTGLGLSMVYGFIRQSGGHVRIYSEPGHGTTIQLYLPRNAGNEAPAPQSKARGEVAHSGRGRNVLVVEDNEAVREISCLMLQELGYRVLEAGDGNAALEALDRYPEIDLLFSDVMLPGGVLGTDVVRTAQRKRPGLRVLLASGYSARTVDTADMAQPPLFINKPFMRDQLVSALEQVFEGDERSPAAGSLRESAEKGDA